MKWTRSQTSFGEDYTIGKDFHNFNTLAKTTSISAKIISMFYEVLIYHGMAHQGVKMATRITTSKHLKRARKGQ